MAVVNFCWQISNTLLLFTLFVSLIGLIARISHIFSTKASKYDLIFVLFYIASLLAIFLQWLVFNALLLLPDSVETRESMSLWFKGAIWFLTLASCFLIYIGYNSLAIRKSLRYKYSPHIVIGIYFLSFILLILVLFTEVTTGEIVGNSPSFDFDPEFTFLLTGIYGLIIGGTYAILSLRSRLRLSDPVKKLIPFYPLYLGFPLVIGGGLIMTSIIIIFDPFTVPMWPCVRMLMSSFVYIGFLWFPTLETFLETSYQNRLKKLETIMERDKVLDIIDHDLANVTQILHSYFESMQLSDQDKDFLNKQVDRMGNLILKSRAIVFNDDDKLIKELMSSYKSLIDEDKSKEAK